MSQGKAKKKLHYHQAEDKCRSQIKIKEVFTLHDIDGLFDSIDANSELSLPMLSQLPKTSGVIIQKKSGGSSDSNDVKAPSEQAPKEALIEANGIHIDGIIDKESPFREIAPIKTSSPIALAAEGDEEMDGIRPMADPLLFGEDEEPIGGDLGKPACTQEPAMAALNSYSASLESPPERLEFRKTNKPAGSLSIKKTKKTSRTSVQVTQSSPIEIKQDSSMNKDPSSKDPRDKDRLLSPVLVHKNEQKRQEKEQCVDQMVEVTGRESFFQHKLKKALMPKSSCSRKTAAPAAPLVDLEEDFMILDDEAPVLFVIPRKTEVSRNKRTVQAKTSKDGLPPQSTEQLLQSEADVNNQQEGTSKRNKAQIQSGKKQSEGNRGKASKKNGKDTVNDVSEQRPNFVSKAQEDRDCDQISQNVQQSIREKAPDELPDREGEDTDSHQIPVSPVSRKTNKSSKSSGSQQKRPGSKAKKESNKVMSTTGPNSTNRNGKSSRKGKAVSKTNKQTSKRQTEAEQIDPVCVEHDSVEPSTALDQQEEEQTTAVKKSLTKQDTLKDPTKKLKKKEIKKLEPKPKDPPPVASDTFSDSPVFNKRKRNPPGAWWLTGQDDSSREGQSETTMCTAKISTKTPTKQTAAEVSAETQSSRPSKSNQKKRKSSSVHNAGKIENGMNNDTKIKQKTAKKTGGQRKIKPAPRPQVPSPTCVSEEEVGAFSDAPEEISPEFCSQYRQHNTIPGEKQVFDKVYTRNLESAQKQSSSSLRRPLSSKPDEVPLKRQRKTTSNWWEVPQSEEPTNEPLLHPIPPTQKSKPTNPPVAFNKEVNSVKSQKTNIKRNIISTPKSIKRSLASMNAIFASEKQNVLKSGQRRRKQGRRNILHSLEDHSDHSSENTAHSDDQMQGNGHASSRFISGAAMEPAEIRNQTSVRVSTGPNPLSEVDVAFRSGPSSMLELQRHDEEDDDIDLPSTKVTPHVRHVPRVLSQCDLCGPPLKTIVLEKEDWKNLQAWFSHLWPPASKDGQVISPDDFHWHSHGGRAMGHAVDLQGSSFSHGKILLGSFMKKPPQMDLDTVSVFSIISSCVRVDIEGEKSVYNSGQVFMIPSGQVYSIHNLCQEPAVLIYHRTQSDDTQC